MRRDLPLVGNLGSVCPHCSQALDTRPGRKKKCPYCGRFIYVRTRPSDHKRVLVTEAQAEQIEEQWSIVQGTHDSYLARKSRFAQVKAELTSKPGTEPTDDQVQFHLLNQDAMEQARSQMWGMFSSTRRKMAEILWKTSDPRNALERFLEVCYLDLNGPNNAATVVDEDRVVRHVFLNGQSPWEPGFGGFIPATLARVKKLIEVAELDREAVQGLFLNGAGSLHGSLRLPVSPERAWQKLARELYAR